MENQEIEIRRRILNVDEIDSNRHVPEKEPNSRKAANYFKNFASNIFPPIKWLPQYRKVYLPSDIISGLTVSMIRLPQVNGINFTRIKSNASHKETKLPIYHLRYVPKRLSLYLFEMRMILFDSNLE